MIYNITQLRISETEFRCIIESISKEVIDTSVQKLFTDTILYRTFNDSDVEQLYSRVKKQISRKIINYIKKHQLLKPQQKWQTYMPNGSIYRLRTLDPDEIDIPYSLYNVDYLLPNLKDSIRFELAQKLMSTK